MPQETVFNLSIDLVQPLLGSLSAVLIRRDLSFQLRNAIFNGSKLMRKLLSHVQRVSAVLFSNASRSVEQIQDRLTRLVELVGTAVLAAASLCGCERDDKLYLSPTIHRRITHFEPPNS